jgi:phosphate starvation-inducible PhoH-like protein
MCTRICWADARWAGRRDEPRDKPRDKPWRAEAGYDGVQHARGAVPRVFESVELTDIRNDNLRARRDSDGDGQSAAPQAATPQGDPRSQVKIVIPADHSMVSLLGSGDELLHVIEREFAADIHVRGNEITATGNPAETALITVLFDELIELQRKGTDLNADAVERIAAMLRAERGIRPADVLTVGILSARGRTIRPKTLNQKRYTDAIDKHTIVFAIGPAGTGKTYLAMAKAVKALQDKAVNRIILTRPAVEAGERLGFLPGTLYEKIDPYLRPLYDALHDMVDPESIPRLIAAGTIEIAPLAFMRGRSLNDSFIILDEAQNTSPEQMKMFLTRLGFGSQIVVTGDVTQVDLPPGQVSGLRIVQDILDDIEDIHFVRLTSHDVVRHRLVGKIVDAYERYDAHERQSQLDSPNRANRPARRKGS